MASRHSLPPIRCQDICRPSDDQVWILEGAWRVDSFRPGDTHMRQWSGSLLVQVTACRLSDTMMTSSNGNIFRVTGPLCGEFTGPRWIPHTKASDAELGCFLWSTPTKHLRRLNGWVNKCKAGDLRRIRPHYDVTVMQRRIHGGVPCIEPSATNFREVSIEIHNVASRKFIWKCGLYNYQSIFLLFGTKLALVQMTTLHWPLLQPTVPTITKHWRVTTGPGVDLTCYCIINPSC